MPLLAAALLVCPPIRAEEQEQPRRPIEELLLAAGPVSGPVAELDAPAQEARPRRSVTFRGEPATSRDASLLLRAPEAGESEVFSQYRRALERESRRLADRNPSLFWDAMVDEDGYPLRGADRVQRDARRLFGGASNRLMSGWLERLLEESGGLRAARAAVEGLRMDVRRGGGVGLSAGPAKDSGRDVTASVGLVVLGRPRMELRSDLTESLRARVEVPLDSLGMRATFSQKFSTGWRGTVTIGSEEDERWISAGLEIDF